MPTARPGASLSMTIVFKLVKNRTDQCHSHKKMTDRNKL